MLLKNIIDWRVFTLLLIGSIIGIIGGIPYSLTLQEDLLKEIPISMPVLISISILQSTVLFILVIFFGLVLARKIGLGTPILDRFFQKKEIISQFKSTAILSIFLGIIAGILIVAGDYIFSIIGSTDLTNIIQTPPPWQGFLISFYGGINEEILLRLFFMSLLIWIFLKIKKSDSQKLNPSYVWFAIILSSILFGLAHLPMVASITNITPLLILRALILNGIGGIIFGWLYWKKGLESSIISHFSADIILHVIVPFLLL